MNPPTFEVRAIGTVESSLQDVAKAPKQGYEGAPDARIRIAPVYQQALDGITAGQEILVLTWLHQARRDLVAVHPRDDPNNPLTGVFATRSADRPNPIGLHRVTILAVEDECLLVRGLEAVHGTPVLDLKPVVAPQPEW
jgi:tRNA-Thr(GGU) m(6)t(6)A37 methyltransferase TsaA